MELQRETLAQVTRGNSSRLQCLYDAQRGLELTWLGSRSLRGEFLQRLPQEAVFVEGVDDQICKHIVALAEAEQQELLAQGIVQSRWRRRPLRPVRTVIAASGAGAGKIEVRSATVSGAFFGLL